MNVQLLAYTPDPDKVVATAAKLCYSDSDINSLMENLTEEKTAKFIDMLVSIGHESPIEHVSFTFGIEGISRACSHQLVRSRIASYSQKSQRYVSEAQFDFITPPLIESDPDLNAMYFEYMMRTQQFYQKLQDALIEKNTELLIADGVLESIAHNKAVKLANEDARFVLPNACETKIVVTMNARSLFNFFKHRCCERSQWEIRAVANEMLRLCKGVAPQIFKYAGPSCVMLGKCPEGKMSCGKANEMKEKYRTKETNTNESELQDK